MTKSSMTKSSSQHIPERTCIACRQIKPKRELIRLVCLAKGSVEVDVSGRKAGRGGYLCQKRACWEAGLKGNRLEYTLRTTLTPENRAWLLKHGKDLLGESSGGKNE